MDIIKLIIIIMFLSGIVSLFVNIGMSQNEIRYGFRPFQFLFSHPTYLVLSCIYLLGLISSFDLLENQFVYEIMLSFIILLSMRTKGIVFVALYFFIKYVGKWLEKHKFIYISAIVLVALIVAYDKIALYNSFPSSPREVLYIGSITLMLQCFPFGSGFCTFASHVSWKFGSAVYDFIKIPFYYENGAIQTAVLGDAGFPYYIAQFGIIGTILCLLAFYFLFASALRNSKRKTGVLMIFVYIMIALTSESILLNNGVELAFVIAICSFLSKTQSNVLLKDKYIDMSKIKKFIQRKEIV